MIKKRTDPQQTQGTFAQLYEVQEELSRRQAKPLGRPPKKVQRKPTTVHLTQSETRNLNKLHLMLSEQVSVNKSELIGVAVDVLANLVAGKMDEILQDSSVKDVDSLRNALFGFIKL